MSDRARYVGGQAVVEGVMMRGETSWAVAVRTPEGDVEVHLEDAPRWSERWQRYPLVRGVAALAESMSLGMRALAWSTERANPREDARPPTKRELTVTVLVALAFFVAVFVVVPALVGNATTGGGRWSLNLVEGAVRLGLFLAYLKLIGRIPDVRRLFEYHGAEHKAIAAFERGAPLTPASAQRFGTEHVRCGTNFILTVLILSIGTHVLVGRPGWLLLVASRVLLVPVVAGTAYELIRATARHLDTPGVRLLAAPGLALQRLTTREPSLDQIEVAIASLRAVLSREQLREVEARPLAA